MRKLLLLWTSFVACQVFGARVLGAQAFVNAVTCQNVASCDTTWNVTAGNVLFVARFFGFTGGGTLSDSLGGSYAQIGIADSYAAHLSGYGTLLATGGTQVTVNSTSTEDVMVLMEFSGATLTPDGNATDSEGNMVQCPSSGPFSITTTTTGIIIGIGVSDGWGGFIYSAGSGTPVFTRNGLGVSTSGEVTYQIGPAGAYTQQFTATGDNHNVACAVMAIKGVQGFTIINPYNGTDGAGPYLNWYGTSTHTHSVASGSSGTVPQMFTDGAGQGLIMIPVNDKGIVSADPGSHPGQYYWPGYEETMTNQHILCLGCTTWPGARTSNQDAIDKIHSQGAIAILAHPTWMNSWSPSDVPGLAGFDGVEVANGQGYTGWDVWDAALFAGRKVIGTAGNDMYSRGYAEVLYINSPTNSMADLLANFRIGNFYGSDICGYAAQGCTVGHAFALRVTQSGNTVTAKFQYSETDSTPQNPAYVTWKCGYPTAGSICGIGASYTITGNEVYVRAVFGNQAYGPMRAWSQPIYVVPTAVPLPAITSPSTASATVGSNFNYPIAATNNPTIFGASGLPAGLTVNAANGVISGVPQSGGSFTIILSAANSSGPGTGPLTLTIAPASGGRVNVASNTNGATAVASSEYVNGLFPAANAITGNKSGAGWSTGTGGWNDNTNGLYPDWLEVDFAGTKNIVEVDVYTLQDNFNAPVTPTAGMTFSQYGITDFEVQYYTGSAWVDVPGGRVAGNNLVWQQFTFAPISTGKIRVLVNKSVAGFSRIVDVEAYESGDAQFGGCRSSGVTGKCPEGTLGDRFVRHGRGKTPAAFKR